MKFLLKYRYGDRNKNNIALTFDDGPSKWTPAVLDILKEQKIKATFFLIPDNIIRLPEVAKRIIEEGHEVGAHTNCSNGFSWTKSFFKKTDKDKIKNSLEAIKKYLKVSPKFFRPSPDVALNRGLEKTLKQEDILPILASAYSRVNKSTVDQFIEITKKLKNGDIILLHDGHDEHIGSDRPEDTLAILANIINFAKDKGFDFVKVSELFDITPYK